MEQEFIDDMPKVTLIPKPRRIAIICTEQQRAYALYDTKTGTQVKDFVKCDSGKIEFDNLDSNMHYDVGVIENVEDMKGDEKPQFALMWSNQMRDTTEEILKNSHNLPVEYPYIYKIRYNDNPNNVYDIVDNNTKKVGEVINLTQSGDKPQFTYVHSFKMADDTKK